MVNEKNLRHLELTSFRHLDLASFRHLDLVERPLCSLFPVPSFRPCGGIPLYSCSVSRHSPFIIHNSPFLRDSSTRLRLAQDDGETRYHSLRMTESRVSYSVIPTLRRNPFVFVFRASSFTIYNS
jgi:hypothetical protein